jgi:hypothetical protein
MSTLTINFAAVKNKTGNSLTLTIEIEGAAAPVTYSATTQNIFVKSFGELELKYDMDERFLVPSNLSLELYDQDGLLKTILFESAVAYELPKATLVIDGATEFSGFGVEESIDYDEKTKTLSIDFKPRTDILNQKMLYVPNDNGVIPSNPLEAIDATQYAMETNSFDGYIYYQFTQENAANDNLPLVTKVIQDCYKLVDSSISVDFGQLWEFGNGIFLDGAFSELKMRATSLLLMGLKGDQTVGDALRTLADIFCCFTGMVHEGKAFFKQLFKYNSSDTQTLGSVIEHRKLFESGLISYVKVVDTGWADEMIVAEAPNAAAFSEQLDDFIEIRVPLGNLNSNGINLEIERTGTDYAIDRVRDTDYNTSWYSHENFIANYHYNWRGNLKNLKREFFKVAGIDYDITKDFTYDGDYYEPISLVRNLDEGFSEIVALKVAALSSPTTNTTTPVDNPLFKTVGKITMNDVNDVIRKSSGVKKIFKYEGSELSNISVTLFNLLRNQRIEKIEVIVSAALNSEVEFKISGAVDYINYGQYSLTKIGSKITQIQEFSIATSRQPINLYTQGSHTSGTVYFIIYIQEIVVDEIYGVI